MVIWPCCDSWRRRYSGRCPTESKEVEEWYKGKVRPSFFVPLLFLSFSVLSLHSYLSFCPFPEINLMIYLLFALTFPLPPVAFLSQSIPCNPTYGNSKTPPPTISHLGKKMGLIYFRLRISPSVVAYASLIPFCTGYVLTVPRNRCTILTLSHEGTQIQYISPLSLVKTLLLHRLASHTVFSE